MIRLECNNCNAQHTFQDNHLEYRCVDSQEKPMGIENEYEGMLEFNCDHCDSEITAMYHFWEYPAMILNSSQPIGEGCTILEEPDYRSYFGVTERD